MPTEHQLKLWDRLHKERQQKFSALLKNGMTEEQRKKCFETASRQFWLYGTAIGVRSVYPGSPEEPESD